MTSLLGICAPNYCGNCWANVQGDGDLSPLPGDHLARLTHRVFVSGEISLDVSFTAAQARLTNLVSGGLLISASAQAYSDGITGLAGVGPLGAAPDSSRLCQVHFQDLKASGDSARFALRWEVIGPGRGLFPALDADITLASAGKHSTTLTLTGVYRTPLGTMSAELGRVIGHEVATATIRAFLQLLGEAIARSAGVAERATKADDPNPLRPPPEPQAP